MVLRSYVKAALWGGAILLAIDAIFAGVMRACPYFAPHCSPAAIYGIHRTWFVLHPIAHPLHVTVILTFFPDRAHPVHGPPPDALVTFLYYGLCFSEAFLYGMLVGVLARIVLPLLTRQTDARRN